MNTQLQFLLEEYIKNPEDASCNLSLGDAYFSIGHTAAAITYYLRGAERSEDEQLTYSALLKGFECYDKQGSRDSSSKIFLQHAIALCPKRPEAYFLLSRYYEKKREWQDSYIYATTALSVCDFKNNSTYSPNGYFGKASLLFEKAVSGYWWGKANESRKIFQDLVNNYWIDLDEDHRNCIQDNISRLGSGPESHAFSMYDPSMKQLIRYQFEGLNKIKRNFSQVMQDMFVLSMLNGKRGGRYVEIGSAGPFHGNNTALLEKDFDWSGFGVEYDEKFIAEYETYRKNPILHDNALTIDYDRTFKTMFGEDVKTIDYLQLDIEPPKHTYEAMLRIPFDQYKFAVITFEHDYYADVTRKYRDLSREFLTSKGYVLVVNDISPDGDCSFEDWWVHPDLVDAKILSNMTLINYDKAHHAKYYMLASPSKVLWKN